MPHLNLEQIARLVDEPPEPHEAAHVDACDECKCELDTMRADSAALASLPPIAPPANGWPALEARLIREALIRPARQIAPRVSSWRARVLRAAAVIAVFIAGTLSGVAWAGSSGTDSIETTSADGAPNDGEPNDGAPNDGAPNDGAPNDGALIVAREPRNAEEAARLAREIEALYFNTLVSVTASRPLQDAGGDPVARLAALEGIMSLTGAALDQAPADPVLNGYHLAAVAQREATLKQIATRADDSWF